MIRVFAWILRFVNNCRKDHNKCKEHELSVAEIENSEKQLIRLTQTYYLPDVESLKFVTFIDNDNILRVKSKITERNDESSFLYPILLPDKCEFTKLLIRSIHKKNCHARIQIMQSLIRERLVRIIKELLRRSLGKSISVKSTTPEKVLNTNDAIVKKNILLLEDWLKNRRDLIF
ncbi:DUF5641 domain-containing protein [Trichonephila clavipes]|nr:DUF5641 domain-containing protein [Trichonephila clavipes]